MPENPNIPFWERFKKELDAFCDDKCPNGYSAIDKCKYCPISAGYLMEFSDKRKEKELISNGIT